MRRYIHSSSPIVDSTRRGTVGTPYRPQSASHSSLPFQQNKVLFGLMYFYGEKSMQNFHVPFGSLYYNMLFRGGGVGNPLREGGSTKYGLQNSDMSKIQKILAFRAFLYECCTTLKNFLIENCYPIFLGSLITNLASIFQSQLSVPINLRHMYRYTWQFLSRLINYAYFNFFWHFSVLAIFAVFSCVIKRCD